MSVPTKIARLFLIVVLVSASGCRAEFQSWAQSNNSIFAGAAQKPKAVAVESAAINKLLESAVEQTTRTKSYDPNYTVIAYPMGDVPIEKGVCTDVVIRAFRAAGVDLQKEIHEDITANFDAYPKKWNLKTPDSNIDHRRVPNLQTFFTRRGKSLPITKSGEDYKPGDVVTWDLNGKGMTHVGLVSNFYNENTRRFSIVHNIGAGVVMEDVVFDWQITGHFRYF